MEMCTNSKSKNDVDLDAVLLEQDSEETVEMLVESISYLEQIKEQYNLMTQLKKGNVRLRDETKDLKQLRKENVRLRDETKDLKLQLLVAEEKAVKLEGLLKVKVGEIAKTYAATRQTFEHIAAQSPMAEKAQQASEMSLSNITYLEQIEKHYDSMTRILTKLEAQNAKLKDGSDELKQLRTENARLRDESLDLASQLLEVKENMVELKSLFKSNTKEISRTHKETQQLSQHVGTQSSLSESN